MSETIDLKILPKYFEQQILGLKNFEIRKNDRGYQIGQYLKLREWTGKRYTGRTCLVVITSITDFKQQKGYVVLGTKSL